MPVYLVRAGDGPVKIGFSDDVATRLVKMQADNHERLILLRELDADRAGEASLHARFQNQHMRGEWFSFSEDMLGDVGFPDIQKLPLSSDTAGARYLREIMRIRGKRQNAVAAKLGVSEPIMSRWANRQADIPARAIRPLAEELGVPLDEILGVAEAAKAEAA